MKYIKKNILIAIILIVGLNIASISAFAETTASITIDPLEPTRKSTITFTAEITTDETIQTVTLEILECRLGLCYPLVNIPMDSSADVYVAEYTLVKDDSTYIEYNVTIVTEEGNTYTSPTPVIHKDLIINPNNGDTNGGSSNDDNGSPGFELVFVLIAIIIAVMFIKRKR